ncbi:MAG: CAP domain-containing protein [Anaerolineae bacterium]|nr:CAP domain-containing protein [Anaerolineae bacterium]
MRTHYLLAILISASAFAAAPARAQDASVFKGCTVVPLPSVNEAFEQRVVELTNDHRASVGLPPLKRVSLLDETARYHANDMRAEDYFDHDTWDLDRVEGNTYYYKVPCDYSQRIGKHYKGWVTLSENIAQGQETPEEVVADWLNSPGHRANIEGKDFREIGVGLSVGETQGCGGTFTTLWWVQNFGARRNVHPLVINREYAQTDNPQVEIYIYGRWAQMRLRNDDGEWGQWQPFSNSFTWQLNAVAGLRQVCAELRSGSRRETTCDTILLTTGAPG